MWRICFNLCRLFICVRDSHRPQVSSDRLDAAAAEVRSSAQRLAAAEAQAGRLREALGRAEREVAEADGKQKALEAKVGRQRRCQLVASVWQGPVRLRTPCF